MRQKQCERCGQWHDAFNLDMSICKKCQYELQEAKQRKKADKAALVESVKIHELQKSEIEFRKLIAWLENSDSIGRFEKISELIGYDELMSSAIASIELKIPKDWIDDVGKSYFAAKEVFTNLKDEVASLREAIAESSSNRSNLIYAVLVQESTFVKLFGSKKNQAISECERIASGHQDKIDEFLMKLELLRGASNDGSDVQDSFETLYREKICEIVNNTDASIEYFRKRISDFQASKLPNKLWIPKSWWNDENGGAKYIKELLISAVDEVMIGENVFNALFCMDTKIEPIADDSFQNAWVVKYLNNPILIFGAFKIPASDLIANIKECDFPRDPRPKDVANIDWNRCYPLRCMCTDSIIKPRVGDVYSIYYVGNGKNIPKSIEINSAKLEGFAYCKFINKSACETWCDDKQN